MTSEERTRLQRVLDEKVRRKCRFIGRKRELLERVTRVTGSTPASIDNVVMWSDLEEKNVEEEIEAQIRYFTDLGHSFEWMVYDHDQPGDLADRLLVRGFVTGTKETVVIAPCDGVSGPDTLGPIELRTITEPGEIGGVLAVGDEIWGTQHHGFLAKWLTDLLSGHGESTIILVAYDGDKPVAASWVLLWDDRPFAPFFGGSVLPGWRGRGIYRAMVAERARAASRKGIHWCLVDAGPESFPILERVGFQTMTGRTSFRWEMNEDRLT